MTIYCGNCGSYKNEIEFQRDNPKNTKPYSYCRDCREWHRQYYLRNRDRILTKIKTPEYKSERNPKRRVAEKTKKDSDPVYNLICTIRSRVSRTIKRRGFSKNGNTEDILGCSFEQFCNHIESLFAEGMNWDNYGAKRGNWQIDHIVPVSSAMSQERIIELNHYTNLRPLWAEENWAKSNKILDD